MADRNPNGSGQHYKTAGNVRTPKASTPVRGLKDGERVFVRKQVYLKLVWRRIA